VVLYTELLCYHPYLVSMLFADLLSLHLVTFLKFFYSCILLTRQRRRRIWALSLMVGRRG